MNVLRSLAREFLNVFDAGRAAQPEPGAKTLNALRQPAVPPVLGLSRFRDGFESFPQGPLGTMRALSAERAFRPVVSAAQLQHDGFEAAPRSPVDLSGGVKPSFQLSEQTPAAAPAPDAGFMASLDDIAALLG